MARELIHRFELNGTRFAIDPETCFCFECDAISWDVLEYYPHTPTNKIYHDLGQKHDPKELSEVVGELEWLRSTKSILKAPTQDEMLKLYDLEKGLKRMIIRLPREAAAEGRAKRAWFKSGTAPAASTAAEIGRAACTLLLSRAGDQPELRLEFREDGCVHNPELIAELCAYALKAAQLAGKKLVVAVHVDTVEVAQAPAALEGHTIALVLELHDATQAQAHLARLQWDGPQSLARLLKLIPGDVPGVAGRIVVRPNHPAFGEVVSVLDEAGFGVIELDLDGAYIANPGLDPQHMLAALGQTAVYYAQRLLQQHYFRLDPIASLFMRIYEGAPLRRADPAGTNELAVDETGGIYPCAAMLGWDEFRLGSVADGTLDESARRRFEDVGSLTTAECLHCWARNLCGGGNAALHQRLSGSFRTPQAAWCEAQRVWMTAAVSAFQRLSSQGVNFTRMYNSLGRTTRPSLFTMARAAFSMSIGMRPIEEADAELLVNWESWTEAAYFLCNEKGMLLATQYDREMDSLHPEGLDRELVLLRKSGEPFGLLKMRPDRIMGSAQAWLYFRNEADYASDSIRKGIRFVLGETGKQQALRRLTVQAAENERGLQQFLIAVGFEQVGVQRQALYLHGAYHNVLVYAVAAESL